MTTPTQHITQLLPELPAIAAPIGAVLHQSVLYVAGAVGTVLIAWAMEAVKDRTRPTSNHATPKRSIVKIMDTNNMCQAAGCGSEMTELVPDSYGRGESLALLAAAPIVRFCEKHAKIMADIYAANVAMAFLHQRGQTFATAALQTVADQLREMKTDAAQSTYAILGQHFPGVE